MPEKDPTIYQIITSLWWVIWLSVWGGFVRFFRGKVANKDEPVVWSKPRIYFEMLGELSAAAFVGVLAFMAAQAYGLSEMWTACLVGIAGHEGAKIIPAITKLIENKGFK